MDSLLANYASDDDDDREGEGEEEGDREQKSSAAASPQLPPPKSSSIFSSALPPPKSPSSSSLFSSPPPPRSLSSDPPPAASGSASGRPGEADGEEKGGIFKARSSLFSFPPPPKPSSSSSSIPNSGNLGQKDGEEAEKGGVSTAFGGKHSLFSALPPPKGSSSSLLSQVPPPKSELSKTADSASSDRNPKRVVQFKVPLNPSVLKSRDLDEDDEEKKTAKDSADAPKTSSLLSSILPAPKNTFGLSSAASASSRRSIVHAGVPAANSEGFALGQGDSGGYEVDNNSLVGAPPEAGIEEAKDVDYLGISTNANWDQSMVEGTVYPGYEAYSGYDDSSAASYWDPGYGGAPNYGNYEGTWSDGTAAVASEIPDIGRISGKRGRNDIPTEIMEVKQDELMKNRPRQDQTKLTGIAFGPSHQPASSGKGKPTKLHKRKHQIGALYFDMRQKETELAERRARGLLTKAETQGKYGW